MDERSRAWQAVTDWFTPRVDVIARVEPDYAEEIMQRFRSIDRDVVSPMGGMMIAIQGLWKLRTLNDAIRYVAVRLNDLGLNQMKLIAGPTINKVSRGRTHSLAGDALVQLHLAFGIDIDLLRVVNMDPTVNVDLYLEPQSDVDQACAIIRHRPEIAKNVLVMGLLSPVGLEALDLYIAAAYRSDEDFRQPPNVPAEYPDASAAQAALADIISRRLGPRSPRNNDPPRFHRNMAPVV